jgi:hypothetical protein
MKIRINDNLKGCTKSDDTSRRSFGVLEYWSTGVMELPHENKGGHNADVCVAEILSFRRKI